MARRSANSLLNSLKGKIWLATSALAFFICTFGLISYLLVSFFTSDTFYAVFIPFLILSFIVMVFGWWLSNEVVSPIEKVSLLAKSLERSSLVTLPKTTGSTETDELLETLRRNSQQLQTIVGLMETVAAGNTDIALTPLQNSDRLSSSFQKLLAKVSESIHAKQELEKLEAAVKKITEDAVRIRKGVLDGDILSDFSQTREISEAFKFLVRNLNGIIRQIRQDTIEAQTVAGKAGKTIRAVIQTDETVVQQMNQAALAHEQMPGGAEKIAREISAAASIANDSIETARNGKHKSQEIMNSAGVLRNQLHEALKRTGSLGESSLEITKIAKTVEDLARRTNLIALNASIQSVENTDKNFSFSVLAEEVERLSVRAENTNNEISSLNKSIAAEILEIENSLKAGARETANLLKIAAETGNFITELEKDAGQFLTFQSKFVSYSSEQSAERRKTFQIFLESIKIREKEAENLKRSETEISGLFGLLESLRNATNAFTSPANPAENEIVSGVTENDAVSPDKETNENAYADLIVDFDEIVSV